MTKGTGAAPACARSVFALVVALVIGPLLLTGTAESAGGSTWLLCIAAGVVALRLALLPFVVHSVRLAHGASLAHVAVVAGLAASRLRSPT